MKLSWFASTHWAFIDNEISSFYNETKRYRILKIHATKKRDVLSNNKLKSSNKWHSNLGASLSELVYLLEMSYPDMAYFYPYGKKGA